MLRDELKKRCIEACEDEFDDIFAKYGTTFTDDEPFEKVEQEEVNEANEANEIVNNNWAWIKQDMKLDKDKKMLIISLSNYQDNIINNMAELAQCFAVVERQKQYLQKLT